MNPTRRNLLASAGMLTSVAALGEASRVLAEEAKSSRTKTAGPSETGHTPHTFAQLAKGPQQDPSFYYLDIRDYFSGTLAHGSDITDAVQEAMDDRAATGIFRIRIPKIPGAPSVSAYAIDGVRLSAKLAKESGIPWIFEFDCFAVEITNPPITFQGPITWRGLCNNAIANFNSFPQPRPRFTGDGTSATVLRVRATNVLIENITANGGGCALEIPGTSNVTVRNCCFESAVVAPLQVESSFWVTLENIEATANGTAPYAIEFTTDEDWGPNCGLIQGRELRVANKGILFRSQFGPEGVGNIEITNLISENQTVGDSLINFDSTNGAIGSIKIIRGEVADPIGGTVYVVKNAGSLTGNFVFEGVTGAAFFDPTSSSFRGIVLDESQGPLTVNAQSSIINIQAATKYWAHWSRRTPTAIDAKLMTAPVGLPWVFGTPLAVAQDPAGWANEGGAMITTGIHGPDGSTMAGRVSGGSGASCYQAIETVTLGDWIIAGVWARRTTGGALSAADTGVIVVNPNVALNGSPNEEGLAFFLEDHIPNNGWQWLCGAFKFTSVGTSLAEIKFLLANNGASTDYFNPCAILIPASAGIDDAWMINLARSLKGGWSSSAAMGDVSILDHQALKVGTGKFTAKTFATLPSSPVAGTQAYIIDCNTTTWGANAAGGGSNKVMVWYNGDNWTVMGK
jgi:hypothetical protein